MVQNRFRAEDLVSNSIKTVSPTELLNVSNPDQMRETDIKLASRLLSTGWLAYLLQQYLTFPNYFRLDCHLIQRSFTLPDLASHSKVSHSSRVSISFRSLTHFQTIFMLYTDICLCILIFSFTSFFFYCFLSSYTRRRLAVESACLIVPCVSLCRWVHFSSAALLYLQVASHLIQKTVSVPDLASYSKASHSQLVCEQDEVPIENIRL